MTFVAGEKLRASDLNDAIAAVDQSIVGRNRRTTDSTQSSSIIRVLSVIAPVVAGRTYRVVCDGQTFSNSGAATSQHELRYTTDNTEPTTSSPVLGRTLTRHDSTGGVPDGTHIEAEFVCTTSGILRVAVCTTRVGGSVAVAWTATSSYPMLLQVIDAGPTVATSGTVY